MTFANMVGQKVPSVTFHTYQEDVWVDIDTDDIFKNKKVILFSLPGAFTPTCSSTHLPRYDELTDEFKALGIDDIYCLSVNDTFVMNAWLQTLQCHKIKALPDGNGEFTEAMGRLVEKDYIGFGMRAWRYSMLVEDGVVIKMFDEPEREDDSFGVSDADTMLKYLNPNWSAKPSVAIFSKPGCSHCAKAKAALTKNGYIFEEIALGRDATLTSVRAITGQDSTPQIFIDGKRIGGNDDLQLYLFNNGKL